MAGNTGNGALGNDHQVTGHKPTLDPQALENGAKQLVRPGFRHVETHRHDPPVERDPALGAGMARQREYGNIRADTRHPQRRGARLGQCGDGPHVHVIGGVHGRLGNAFVHSLECAFGDRAGFHAGRHPGFGAPADGSHGRNGLGGILPHRAFRRQHHCIGSVHDRIGNVRNLRAGRHRTVDHRLHHLRSGYDDPVPVPRATNNQLLLPDKALVTGLYSQVAARHHHRVGGIQDFVEVIQRLRPLDLGDNVRGSAGFPYQPARRLDVGAVAHEGHGDPVQLRFGCKLEVPAVLFSKRRHRKQTPAPLVHALVIGNHAAVDHAAVHSGPARLLHLELHVPVVHQQGVTGRHILAEGGEIQPDAVHVARVRVQLRIEEKFGAIFQPHRTVRETGDTDLRALKVAQQGHAAAQFRGRRSRLGNAPIADVPVAVREIEPQGVGAILQDAAKDFRPVGRRSQGRNDFRAPHQR